MGTTPIRGWTTPDDADSLSDAAEQFSALAREIDEWAAALQPVVFQTVQEEINQSLTLLWVDFLTTSFNPPAHWNTYAVLAYGIVGVYTNPVPAAYSAEARFRIAGSDGPATSFGWPVRDKVLLPAMLSRGLTGAQNVALQIMASSTADSPEARNGSLTLTCVRES